MNTKTKIVSVTSLKKKLSGLRKTGKKIAFTNGCFDLLHFGHVDYLEKAKRGGRILIVGLNSDASVKKIKGAKRPVVSQKERAAVLAALESVDYVTIFGEETPKRLISALKPDILVKGADWEGKEVVGQSIVEANGGRVELIRYLPKYSTTKIISTIIKKCRK